MRLLAACAPGRHARQPEVRRDQGRPMWYRPEPDL